jgi:hypothetical protein
MIRSAPPALRTTHAVMVGDRSFDIIRAHTRAVPGIV